MRESKTEADFILNFHGKSPEIFLSSRLNFVVQAALLSKLWQRSKIEERHENQKLLKHICFDCMLRSSYAEALTFIFIPFESFSNELFMAATEHSFTSRSHKKWICWNVLLRNVVLFQHFAIHLLTERRKIMHWKRLAGHLLTFYTNDSFLISSAVRSESKVWIKLNLLRSNRIAWGNKH